MGTPTGVLVLGADREWLLQPEAAEAGVGDQFPSVGGMLCLPGGNLGGAVPREDAPLHGIPEDNNEVE